MESQLPGLPVVKLKLENGQGSDKVLHQNHILPIRQEVQLRLEKNKDTLKPKRRASKWLKPKRTENCNLSCFPAPEHDDKMESASDSEDDEMGVWYDYHSPQESKEPELQKMDQSESFSLDLGLAILTGNSEMEEATAEEPAAADENEPSVRNNTAERTAEAERHTETQMIDGTTERRNSIAENSDETK